MADRADAADALGDQRHLEEHAAFAELLEAAELVDVKDRLFHLALVVEVHADLGVPFDAGYGLNHYFLCHTSPSMPVQEFALDLGHAAVRQLGEHVEDRIRARRAAGQVDVHRHDRVDRAGSPA